MAVSCMASMSVAYGTLWDMNMRVIRITRIIIKNKLVTMVATVSWGKPRIPCIAASHIY